jgi:nucleoside 2-deoxyribosyltransferase
VYRVYFARAMDGLERESIEALTREVEAELLRVRLRFGVDLHLVDPFREVESFKGQETFEERARRIVEEEIALLKTADGVLMDCSIPDRSYVGCICELVYAYQEGIPVVVYVGSSGNDKRLWLHYHATQVCVTTRRDAIEALAFLLRTQLVSRPA